MEVWKLYPSPHDGPRSPGMDVGCWEVKWDHRDDCVGALMVCSLFFSLCCKFRLLTTYNQSLRRVPHLTVTWAHHQPPFGFEQRFSPHNHPQLSAVSYPLHAQERMRPLRGRSASPTNLFHTIESDSHHIGSDATTTTAGGLSKDSTSTSTKADDDNDDWTTQSDSLNAPPESTNDSEEPTSATTREWSEMDFPPLSRVKGQIQAEHGVWGGKTQLKKTSPRSCYFSIR
jgi:hypothetical protein